MMNECFESQTIIFFRNNKSIEYFSERLKYKSSMIDYDRYVVTVSAKVTLDLLIGNIMIGNIKRFLALLLRCGNCFFFIIDDARVIIIEFITR